MMQNSPVEAALGRLDAALARLDAAIRAREARGEAERRDLVEAVEAARAAESTARRAADDAARRLEAAIGRLQTILED